MELLKILPWHRAVLAVVLNLLALSLSTTALLGSYWCVGTQKVPKPLCGKSKATECIGVHVSSGGGASNSSSQDAVHYSWETGDDRFAFRYFHTGMWLSCEENMEGPGSISIKAASASFLLQQNAFSINDRCQADNTRERYLLHIRRMGIAGAVAVPAFHPDPQTTPPYFIPR